MYEQDLCANYNTSTIELSRNQGWRDLFWTWGKFYITVLEGVSILQKKKNALFSDQTIMWVQ